MMMGLEILYKSTNDISTQWKKTRKLSPPAALPSPLSVVPTPGPHPDTQIAAGSRVSLLLAAGYWLTHQL